MLVVMTVIAVLAALLLPAIMRAFVKGPEAKNRQEITALENALKAFYNDYGFYPPSRLRLCDKWSFYATATAAADGGAALDDDSKYYLLKMFTRMKSKWTSPGMSWNGDGRYKGDVILYGDQCLVFFLGGQQNNTRLPTTMPLPNAFDPSAQVYGFSTQPDQPANDYPFTGSRTKPYFKFESARLVQFRNEGAGGTGDIPGNPTNVAINNNYFSYLDYYATRPYAYFSSSGLDNFYNRYKNGSTFLSDCPDIPGSWAGWAGGLGGVFSGRTPAAANNLWPYQEDDGKYVRPNTFQLISAGRDKIFGYGSNPNTAVGSRYFWTTSTASLIPENPSAGSPALNCGRDDQANFARGPLQAGP